MRYLVAAADPLNAGMHHLFRASSPAEAVSLARRHAPSVICSGAHGGAVVTVGAHCPRELKSLLQTLCAAVLS